MKAWVVHGEKGAGQYLHCGCCRSRGLHVGFNSRYKQTRVKPELLAGHLSCSRGPYLSSSDAEQLNCPPNAVLSLTTVTPRYSLPFKWRIHPWMGSGHSLTSSNLPRAIRL